MFVHSRQNIAVFLREVLIPSINNLYRELCNKHVLQCSHQMHYLPERLFPSKDYHPSPFSPPPFPQLFSRPLFRLPMLNSTPQNPKRSHHNLINLLSQMPPQIPSNFIGQRQISPQQLRPPPELPPSQLHNREINQILLYQSKRRQAIQCHWVPRTTNIFVTIIVFVRT